MNPDFQALVNAIDRLTAATNKGTFDYVNLAVLLLTFAAVLYYTAETVRIRKASQRQTEAMIRPVISIRVEPPESPFVQATRRRDQPSHLMLRNEGLGPAFNLVIADFRYNGQTLMFDLGSNVIRPGEEREIIFDLDEGNHSSIIGTVNELYHWLATERLPNPTTITVQCMSVSSTHYTFRFSFIPEVGRVIVKLNKHPGES